VLAYDNLSIPFSIGIAMKLSIKLFKAKIIAAKIIGNEVIVYNPHLFLLDGKVCFIF
jgi:hypothetical protein